PSAASESGIDLVPRQQALDVIDDVLRRTPGVNGLRAHLLELPVSHGQHDTIVLARCGRRTEDIETVFVLDPVCIRPRVVDVDRRPEALQFMDDVHDARVAYIRTVFLEGDTEH